MRFEELAYAVDGRLHDQTQIVYLTDDPDTWPGPPRSDGDLLLQGPDDTATVA